MAATPASVGSGERLEGPGKAPEGKLWKGCLIAEIGSRIWYSQKVDPMEVVREALNSVRHVWLESWSGGHVSR